MRVVSDRRALFTLLSLLLFMGLNAFLTDNRVGALIIVASGYAMFVAATLEVAERGPVTLLAVFLSTAAALAMLASAFFRFFWLNVAQWLLVAAFFAFIVVRLFTDLGCRAPSLEAGSTLR